MQVRYFYAWIPAVALSAFLIFTVPFLGPIAFMAVVVAAVAALGKLAWRIVAALHAIVGFVLRRLREPGGAAQREGATPAISVYREHAQDGLTAHAQTAMALEHQRS
jgi:cell division protein FtsW (lipid II flippase)